MRLSRLVEELVRHAPSGQVVRYLVVGAWNTLFGYGLYALLNFVLVRLLGGEYLAAMAADALANVIAISVAFLGYKLWVFRTKGNFLREYLRCYLVYGATFCAGLVLLPLLIAALNPFFTPRTAVPYLAGAILTAGKVVVSFFGHKQYTFAQNTLGNTRVEPASEHPRAAFVESATVILPVRNETTTLDKAAQSQVPCGGHLGEN